MNYGDIVSRAWKIFWKQKAIWLFYIVCMLPVYVYSYVSALIDPTGGLNSSMPFLIASTVIVWVISILLTTYGQIGMIRGIYRSYEDPLLMLSFRDIFDEVPPRFGKTLAFYFLTTVASVFLGGILAGSVFLLGAGGGAEESVLAPILIGCWCLLIPVLIFLGILYQQMTIALIASELSIKGAIIRGWDVVRKNIGTFIVLSLIVLGIGIGFAIVIGIPAMCTLGAYLDELVGSGMADLAMVSTNMPWYVNIISVVYSIVGTIFGIFPMAIFVIAYLELTKGPGWKKLESISQDELETI